MLQKAPVPYELYKKNSAFLWHVVEKFFRLEKNKNI